MSNLLFKTAATVFALGCALAVPVANAGASNLVANSDFSILSAPGVHTAITDWTSNLYQPTYVGASTEFVSVIDTHPTENALNIYNYGRIGCAIYCPVGQKNSITQQINNLVHGDQYNLSFFLAGWSRDTTFFTNPGAFTASLGSQTVGTIFSPYFDYFSGQLLPWALQTLNFTYNGPTGSAPLTFTRYFTGVTDPTPPACFPCSNNDYSYVSDVSLTDIGGASGGGGVSEPGTLAIVALGLAALALFYSRRRNGMA